MLLLADCANKLSDLKKLQKLHIILVIVTFPALGFLLLSIMFEKTVLPEKLKRDKDELRAYSGISANDGIAEVWVFVAMSAR